VKRRLALLGSNQPRDNRMWGALKNAPGGAEEDLPHQTPLKITNAPFICL